MNKVPENDCFHEVLIKSLIVRQTRFTSSGNILMKYVYLIIFNLIFKFGYSTPMFSKFIRGLKFSS